MVLERSSERAATDLVEKIEKLVAIGVGMTAEKDSERLLEMILLGAKELTGADGGTLYLATEDRRLAFAMLHTDSLGFAMGGTSGNPIPFEPLPLYREDGTPNLQMVVGYAAISGEVVNIPDAYAAEGFDFSGTRAFDAKTGYHSKSFLTVPMKNHEDVLIGVLQLLNAIDPVSGEIVPFSAEAERLVVSLASQASVALTKNRLIADLKGLFQSLIHLIADAIDSKSPYTGGHCRRVPVIAMMLADAVATADDGPLADLIFSEKERYELEIAAWLHDCGKITTPEYVVDKATKLETIFDRMKLVESRFEILRRDAEIAMLRARLAETTTPADDPLAEYQATLQQLQDDLAFLQRCNTGGEFMATADQDRVRELAQRYSFTPGGGETVPLLCEDEVENLVIARGTLNDRERRVINSHVEVTVQMLEALPLPTDLKRIPEIAGGHHERIDGKGYPRGLKGEEMSVQARIMAIADVFEALTAGDRPYKKAKTLSETLKIMGFMSLEGHIDPELFRIFVVRQVYLTYARHHMKPEQIDAVDPAAIPGFAG